MKILLAFTCCGILLLAGCMVDQADELAVFEDRLLNEQAMEPFLGTYTLVDNDFGCDTGTLVLEQKDDRYLLSFRYTDGQGRAGTAEGEFLLSRIPRTRIIRVFATEVTLQTQWQTILFASPRMTFTGPIGLFGREAKEVAENIFFLVGRQGNRLDFWLVGLGNEMLYGCPKTGRFAAEEVKAFLAERADEYVEGTRPVLSFRRE